MAVTEYFRMDSKQQATVDALLTSILAAAPLNDDLVQLRVLARRKAAEWAQANRVDAGDTGLARVAAGRVAARFPKLPSTEIVRAVQEGIYDGACSESSESLKQVFRAGRGF